ncbi:MAG TPA: patatin-like phospholipase family protein [Prolixibacteraceae bacterium]|nr:patatin-like phospholipase family protein [Prolixibacteraceae bacterium]HPS12533.1 patatin-like phospholipase family protein [Prolixibacteraceae bacterium]
MKKPLLSIFLIILALTASPQKVGLVLSGGGAKGIAHIGLIKVLEDHNIPIDYVAGTSIGAIVGGLYAAGFSPEDMLELFKSNDFALWSTGKMDKEDLYYFKRKDEMPDWMKVDITKKKNKIKFVLPMNLIPERQMDFGFMQLLAQTTAACDGNFDNLMVPFRCVSTDIYHNEAIIHHSGDLGEAIRASMTFPMVYKPIEKDGMLLFDGGIVNNFPTDIMKRDFNPDIIIGHKVSNLGKKPDPDDVFGQIEAMVTQITNYNIPDTIGMMLESKMEDVGLLDFPKVNYIYSLGVETALQQIDSIEKIVTRRVPTAEVEKKRETFNMKKPPLVFNNVQVEGIADDMQRKYIIQSIKPRGKVVDIFQLKESYFKLIADEHIKSIEPYAYYNKKTGYFDLNLKIEPRKPFDADFGGHISTRANTFGYVGLNYKTFKTMSFNFTGNVYFGKIYNSLLLGGRIDYPSLTPFYLSTYYTINSWDYLSTSSDLIFSDIKPTYVVQNERNLRLEIGTPYEKTGLISAGISRSTSNDRYYQTKVFNKGDDLDLSTFKAFASHICIDQKKYDFKQYPTEGVRKMLQIKYINGTESFTPGTTAPISEKSTIKQNYFQIEALYDQYFPIRKHITLGAYAEGLFNNRKLSGNYTGSIIEAPAFQPTPNSKSLFIENFHANQYFAAGGKFIYKYNDNLHFRTEVFGFLPIQSFVVGEKNTVSYNEKIFTKAYLMGVGALVYQTPIGPLSAEVDYYNKEGQKWFFSVNLGYMLFNKRGY